MYEKRGHLHLRKPLSSYLIIIQSYLIFKFQTEYAYIACFVSFLAPIKLEWQKSLYTKG